MPDIAAIVRNGQGWLLLERPVQTICAERPSAVRRALEDVERLSQARGCHAVGFVTYEAGGAFGLAVGRPAGRLPLVWFGLFDAAEASPLTDLRGGGSYELRSLEPSVSRAEFEKTFHQIKAYLAAGDSYQINYTFRLSGRFVGDPRTLFADLVDAQRGGYAAFVDTGREVVCSASPELFFERDGARLLARPMKGTARRGRTLDEDRAVRDGLRGSPKQRAENVMIVDMIRNDLGRVAEVGSVRVPLLFSVERYPNVWQMTSEVCARSAASLADIFEAMHPSASVTGAPKARTMELLQKLEQAPRGVYTGAIGEVHPSGRSRFNVAIRTAVLDPAESRLDFGIGSGIVWDSDASEEYDECLAKGAVLGQRPGRFRLMETLRWTPDEGYFLLERHLDRLTQSAEYFEFLVDEGEIRRALAAAVADASESLRVRLLVAEDGATTTEQNPFVSARDPARVRFALTPVDPSNIYLYHKTTNRSVYDRVRQPDCDDVILWNASGEVTESTVANLILEHGGALLTPPLSAGLLPGTLRGELLAGGRIREAPITKADVRRAAGLWLINSVQGWRRALILDS